MRSAYVAYEVSEKYTASERAHSMHLLQHSSTFLDVCAQASKALTAVSIRQHTSAYVSIRQHTYLLRRLRKGVQCADRQAIRCASSAEPHKPLALLFNLLLRVEFAPGGRETFLCSVVPPALLVHEALSY
jgi:hypothetical protein